MSKHKQDLSSALLRVRIDRNIAHVIEDFDARGCVIDRLNYQDDFKVVQE